MFISDKKSMYMYIKYNLKNNKKVQFNYSTSSHVFYKKKYKRCILAEFCGRKDGAVGINKLLIIHIMCTVQ